MKSRIIMGCISVIMLFMFVFPMWKIKLMAPQYPDGLSMFIWVNKLTGDTESSLGNINLLNHYIGMKGVNSNMFPELKIFPYVIVGLSILALICAWFGKKRLYLYWGILVSFLGIIGVYDFYIWLYDYGHELKSNAAIKIAGIAYTPPLFGYKKLLNFHVWSYPQGASYIVVIAVLLALFAWFISEKKAKKTI